METYRFELPPDKGTRRCNIRSITLRETNGPDETMAAQLAEAKGKQGSVSIETIRLSIVAVDDKPASQPFGDLDTWNTRTRNLVAQYWDSINGTSQGEAENFIKAAKPVPAASRPALSVAASSGEDG